MSNSKVYMKLSLSDFLSIVGVFVIILLSAYVAMNIVTYGKYYNCDISEISPDYPIKVKEQCRNLRKNNTYAN
jgi:hypothetical protein